MKPNTLMIVLLSLSAVVTGCERKETASQQLDRVQEKAAAAAQDMKDYTFAQKAEFTATMEAQLAAINKDLDVLETRIAKSGDAVKAEARPKLQALREQAAVLDKQLNEVRNATESTWDSVKTTTRKAYGDLKDGFNQARQWVSDKIAP